MVLVVLEMWGKVVVECKQHRWEWLVLLYPGQYVMV